MHHLSVYTSKAMCTYRCQSYFLILFIYQYLKFRYIDMLKNVKKK